MRNRAAQITSNSCNNTELDGTEGTILRFEGRAILLSAILSDSFTKRMRRTRTRQEV